MIYFLHLRHRSVNAQRTPVWNSLLTVDPLIIAYMKTYIAHTVGFFYRHVVTKVIFRFDSEPIHDFLLNAGERMGKVSGIPWLLRSLLQVRHPALRTSVSGITFDNPIGIAAGFDHEAQLTQVLSGLGFGFGSVGTITNGAYGGNEYPRMKRLVRSRSLLVNKGFKSSGIDANIARLRGATFDIPIGISIGRTNSDEITDHDKAIADILEAFRKTKEAQLPFSYYELNISCPNLNTKVEFYEPTQFQRLLSAIKKLDLDKPLFVKMPISVSDETTIRLVDVCKEFDISAIIFGNLQHRRDHPAFDATEIKEYEGKRGNWSGMPCQDRSDELIALAYRHTNGSIPIIGCGGTFTAEDAYRKIRNGASLVQLVTALVFEGPQVPAEINAELPKLLARDGFRHVADAVGVDVRR